MYIIYHYAPEEFCLSCAIQMFALLLLLLLLSLHVQMYVYRPSSCCFFLFIEATVSVLCLASLVGPVHVLSAVMFL